MFHEAAQDSLNTGRVATSLPIDMRNGKHVKLSLRTCKSSSLSFRELLTFHLMLCNDAFKESRVRNRYGSRLRSACAFSEYRDVLQVFVSPFNPCQR